MSSLPSYASNLLVTKSKFNHEGFINVASGGPPSTEVSQASGSESDPSDDNME